jgi:hypothetical protein
MLQGQISPVDAQRRRRLWQIEHQRLSQYRTATLEDLDRQLLTRARQQQQSKWRG